MKICIVSINALPIISIQHSNLYAGGAEVQLAQLAVALARNGHEVSLVVGNYGQPDNSTFLGVRTIICFNPTAGLPGLRFIYPRMTGLFSAFRRANADLYIYSSAGMVLGLLAIFCRAYGRRFIFRVASDSDCDPRALLVANSRDRWLYEYGLVRANAILVQSNTQKAAMLHNYGLDGRVVRSFIDRPIEREFGSPKNIDVLWVSNIRRLKRPDRFLELAAAMPQYRFCMVGGDVPGELNLFRDLEARSREIPNLVFQGKVSYQEVGKFFDRARVLANTSEIEGFPNTFLQAWDRGIPVVTLFDPDNLVKRNMLGSSHINVAEMTEGIDSLLRSESLYLSASKLSLEFMKTNFNERDVLKSYVDAMEIDSADVK